jgi:hypothetical protein
MRSGGPTRATTGAIGTLLSEAGQRTNSAEDRLAPGVTLSVKFARCDPSRSPRPADQQGFG